MKEAPPSAGPVGTVRPGGMVKSKSTPVPEDVFTTLTPAFAPLEAVAPTFILFKLDEVVGRLELEVL